MAIDPNSMASGYGGDAAPTQQQDPAAGLPKATTPMGGVSNMVQALMKGYLNNKNIGQPQGNAPLTQSDGLGVPGVGTSQAAMGGGAGGAVFDPTQDQTVNAIMTPPPYADPYSNLY